MRVGYHPEARKELVKAGQYYEERVSGLGQRFLMAVDLAAKDMKDGAARPVVDAKGRRKWRVKRFPYYLIYKLKGGEIFVLAVAHASRKPGYWENRDI
jgi:mRNA-degrading endonuclease RelE of RelBE toxin-antitoxin system